MQIYINKNGQQLVILIIFAICLVCSCKDVSSAQSANDNKAINAPFDVQKLLQEKYGIKTVPKIPTIEGRIHPLVLRLEIAGDDKYALSKPSNTGKEFISETSTLAELAAKLIKLFKERNENLIFKEGTNEVERRVYLNLPDDKKITQQVLEKSIEEIKKTGAEIILYLPKTSKNDAANVLKD